MVGRGATGRPWRLAEISHALFGTPYVAPTADQKLESLLAQIRASVELYDEKLGVRVVRKHVAAFVDAWCEDYGVPMMAETRVALCKLESADALLGGVQAALGNWKAAA
jgi:tRNA-dihydrouridine synthase